MDPPTKRSKKSDKARKTFEVYGTNTTKGARLRAQQAAARPVPGPEKINVR